MMKKRFWITGFIAGLWILAPALAASLNVDTERLKKELEGEIQASGTDVSLAFKDLETGDSVLIREREMMHAASTMKVPVMIEVFKQAEEGKFRLDARLLVKNEFRSLVDSSPFSLRPEDDSDPETYAFIGQDMAIRELVERMITTSSNLATNILIDLVQAKNVMATLEEMGISGMEVLRGVEDALAYKKGLNNRTDALALMQVMEAIAAGRAVSRSACREMIDILTRQKFRGGIPAGLPESVRVGNKTGSITGIEHDAAIVFPPGRKPYILAILTRGVPSTEAGEKLIARLSAIVYRVITGN
jgi:beta-lactamase class A